MTNQFATQRRAERAARGLSKAQQEMGIPSEIGLARQCSPNKGSQHLGFARALVEEMPHTLRQLETGELTEWRATILVRETACLSKEDRGTVDRELCSDPATLAGKGDNQLKAAAIALGAELDAESMVRRARKAEANRRHLTAGAGHHGVSDGVAADEASRDRACDVAEGRRSRRRGRR
ncbi:hypothetical protein [Antrihabitans stalagmiti]|uniref:hypothetical protein n=1 Tax=Antrihabitans stalagmiti TaxID=2799499 RepID=UPI001F43B012|nr:hypothetical protein [Antrihabitans stalagmiti]